MILYVIPLFAPLLGFLGAGLLGDRLGSRASQILTITFMSLACMAGWIGFINVIEGTPSLVVPIMDWIRTDTLNIGWVLRYDRLSCLMIMVVTTVSLCVHIYSIGYMKHDPSIPRFMAYLSLFTFMMLMLVTADNLLQLFFGWEGVGLTSYLLIGYWYERNSANAAAMKAFLVNRIADLALIVGLAIIYIHFSSLNLETVLNQVGDIHNAKLTICGFSVPVAEAICLCLFIGAMGKSAQIGFHIWLPDAMEGPTPVSALIHAATMVTAGIFLVVRLSPLYEIAPFTRDIMSSVGAFTAFFAGTVALTQRDIKRIIAYSTCSQLGFMFLAAGFSAYGAAMFHLTTHAFFKALLFLGSGAIIHAMSDEQDIFKMGGIWKHVPLTYSMMWVGSLALAGIPIFAGYFSKHAIFEAVFSGPTSSFGLKYFSLISLFLTAFYTWRLLWVVFHGSQHADERVMGHLHEAPFSMTLPMIILTAGSIFSGLIFHELSFFPNSAQDFWNEATAASLNHAPNSLLLKEDILIQAVSVTGIVSAILLYGPYAHLPSFFVTALQPLYHFLFKKWYFDEIYDVLFVRPSLKLSSLLWWGLDIKIIDKGGPNGVAAVTQNLAGYTSRLHTGALYHYALAIIVGILMLTTAYTFL